MRLFVSLMFLVLLSCSGKKEYRIAGVFSGYWRVEVLLISEENGQRDTLAVTEDINGRFVLNGQVKGERKIYIEIVSGRNKLLGRVDFLLKGGDFMVYVTPDKQQNIVLEEREARKLATRFYDNEKRLIGEKERLINEYVAVDEAGKDSLGRVFTRMIEAYEKQETALFESDRDAFVTTVMLFRSIFNYVSGVRKFDYSLGDRVQAVDYELREWELIKERYASLGNEKREELHKKRVGEYMANIEKKMKRTRKALEMSEGAIAPDFISVSPEGNAFSLYGVKEKLKLVHFWSSYCGPCRVENRHLVDLYKSFHQKGFEIISISCDTKKENWLKAIAEDKLPWKHHGSDRNEKGSIADSYGFSALPSTLLVDENNRIIGRNLSVKRLEEQLKERLK
ncbi:TlpA disulfide reductase family protein [Gabonibacter chumensis]|uniref:TlpA disulfide reductase family protein n=1 Tax=Gabonibacter chumensis TaxID=2972474 RepID=UPI00257307FF|nr:TlpA disulfide reductase family protein [Gabonibacter chumensis]MCR9012332.1 AhpC/TSA family protein [Gabonibacter chumensis]